MAETILATEGLVKRFGGLVATDRLSLEVAAGEVHAIIGPNGAGKTTLVAQIAGELRPDAGAIRFLGEDITQLPAHRRSLKGLARSFQITSIFQEFTALDNVALAVQAHDGHSFRFWTAARRDPALTEPALAMLDQVGLKPRAQVQASHLAHGEKRALEIAMALAARPRLLLLDEPTAGMGPDDSARMVRMLARLKGTVTILLIEHDMDAVFALADRITVLVYGRAIATGAPAAIRDNPEVRQAYLGEDDFGRSVTDGAMTRVLARASLLCLVAGYVDAIGYTELGGVFAANMTGNSVLLAIAAARGEGTRVMAYGFTLVAFLAGAMAASALRRATGRPTWALLAAIALLLIGAVGDMGSNARLALLAATMGLQGGAVTRFGATPLQTVVVTGTLVRLADHLIEHLLPSAPASEPGATRIHALAWIAYGGGAALAIIAQRIMRWPLLIAALVLLAVTIDVASEGRRTAA